MNGYVDGYQVGELGRYERELYLFLEARRADVLTTIREKCTDKKAFKDVSALMDSALKEFAREFIATPAATAAA